MKQPSPVKAFVISAPASGCGKTTVTLGIIAALRRRGLTVQPFKAGPDYIDAAYHSKLAGRACINLDDWMTSPEFVKETFYGHCTGADIAVIEGVMGLFDGADDGSGSTAGLARLLNLPVLHVIDAGKSAQTAAAVLFGMESFDPQLQSCGAVFNGIAGASHWTSLSASAQACRSPALGYLPKNEELSLPERQLGLISAHEHGLPELYLDTLVQAVETQIDLNRLVENAGTFFPAEPVSISKTPAVRLGIAKDEAFCFYYQDNLDLMEQAGIELVEFSPLNDTALPEVNGLYFGGGFPEEFAGRLAQNKPMRKAVGAFAGKIFAECGGLIYLCKTFTGLDGSVFPMVGKIGGAIRMTTKLQACGYREVVFNRDTLLGPKGTVLRGHEFHWSAWETRPTDDTVFQTGEHAWGYADEQLLASYFHVHFGSNPAAVAFLKTHLT